MDKLRLYTSQRGEIQRHIKEQFFECTGNNKLKNGLNLLFFRDKEVGIYLTHTPSFITIECNPTKIVTGNNYKQIDRKQLELFAEILNDRYKTNFGLWDVSLFDFNSDIIVNDNPSKYFRQFGNLKNWERTSQRKGNLIYRTTSNSRAFILYDLHKRCIKDKTPIPPDNERKKIIRLEASFNKDLPKIKALKSMRTLNEYLQPNNYKQLPQIWLDTYELIEKNEQVVEIPELTKKESDMLAAIQLHSLNGYRSKLKIDYPKNYRYYFRQVEKLMEKVREHRNKDKKSLFADFQELDKKVRERAKELILAA